MSEQEGEPTSSEADPKPQPLKVDVPLYDYVEKGRDPEGIETKDTRPNESK
jgi:hypothetical protein